MENLVVLFCSSQIISKGTVPQSLGLKRRTVVSRALWDRFSPEGENEFDTPALNPLEPEAK